MIKLTNVYKTFKVGIEEIHALNNINLHIKEGEFLAIVGPSGSGKSTLLHLIGGLDTPTKGTIIVDNKNLANLSDNNLSKYRNQKIGFIFQDFKLQENLKIIDNVKLPQLFSKSNKKINPETILTQVGLKERTNHTPNQISGGQKQRVAIARALINSPKIIIADEPTGNLDQQTGAQIISLLKQIHQTQKTTIIIVTHDKNIAKNATRVIEIKDGKLETNIETQTLTN